jgi:hypothetical protein
MVGFTALDFWDGDGSGLMDLHENRRLGYIAIVETAFDE